MPQFTLIQCADVKNRANEQHPAGTVPSNLKTFSVADYDLDSTLSSGQAFRWQLQENAWTGIIGSNWVRLRSDASSITAEVGTPVSDWNWLTHYLQLEVDLPTVLMTFPADDVLGRAQRACRGLRLLRQDPWECLASFILSSTKQIVQIQQIVGLLCERYGEPLPVAAGYEKAYSFPTAAQLARTTEPELRACKMGFRAPYLLETSRAIAASEFDLQKVARHSLADARQELMQLPGVGKKIADCVLLFAYGVAGAFPVDVWVMKALRQLYFPKRRVSARRLQRFIESHFGPNAGYAQQYLFHYMRTKRP